MTCNVLGGLPTGVDPTPAPGVVTCYDRDALRDYAWTWVDEWIKPYSWDALPASEQIRLSARMGATIDGIAQQNCGPGEVWINTHQEDPYGGMIIAAQWVAKQVLAP